MNCKNGRFGGPIDKVSIQQRQYPTRVCKGKTREETFPQLAIKRKTFDANDFDIDRIYQTLAKANFVRKVSKDGRIALFGNSYQIGRKYARSKVSIVFSLEKKQWVAKDDAGKVLKEFEADTITKQNILNLSLCQ